MVSVAIPFLLFGGMKLTATTLSCSHDGGCLAPMRVLASFVGSLFGRFLLIIISICGLDLAPAGGL